MMAQHGMMKHIMISTLAFCISALAEVPVYAEESPSQKSPENLSGVYDNDCTNCKELNLPSLFLSYSNAHSFDSLCTDVKLDGVRDTMVTDFGVTTITGKKITASDVAGKYRLYLYFSPECGYCIATLRTLAATNYIDNPNVKIILFTDYDTIPDGFVTDMGLEKYDIVKSNYYYMHLTQGSYRPMMVFINPDGTANSYTTGPRLYAGFFARILGYTDTLSLSFAQSEIQLTVNAKTQVSPEFAPSNASNQLLTWASSDTAVATVESDGTVTALKPGTAAITAFNGTKSASYNVTVTQQPVIAKQQMYRLYNPNSGEHFYTKDGSERDHLSSLGWKYEGVGWTAPETSNTPVYRLYNPNAGEHHYTMDSKERDNLVKVGWRYEGIGWYSDDAKAVPVYREYNPNAFKCNHNYTTDKKENDWLVSLGWRAEGIGWYGM